MKRTSKKVQMMCATMVMVVGTLGMSVNASAAEKTKNFKLHSGDGMTLSNYVDERKEEITIDEKKEVVTYYLVNDNTKILFNVTEGNNIGGDVIQSELVNEKEYATSAAFYLGDSWGWPEDYPALSAFEFSYFIGDKEHTDYSPLAGVSMFDYDSVDQTSDAGYTPLDSIKVYMMRAENSAPPTKADNTTIIKEETKSGEKIEALPTTSNVVVNDKKIDFDAFTIKANNYFKLRDLAYVLSGTEKQFEVSWDKANNAIVLTSGVPYTKVGSELSGKGDGNNIISAPTSSKILLDGKEIALNAYTINGNNYFKLRDMGQLINFSVLWDSAKKTINIDSKSEYVEQTTQQEPYITNNKIERDKIESGELELIVPEWHTAPEEDPSMEEAGSYKADNPALDTTGGFEEIIEDYKPNVNIINEEEKPMQYFIDDEIQLKGGLYR